MRVDTGRWTDMTAPESTVARKRAEMRSRYFTRDEARRLGWNVAHPDRGGAFLEEQEVVDYFPELVSALGRDRPDFAALGRDGKPNLIIECKAQAKRIETALTEAKQYAEAIASIPGHDIRLAVGVAGTPDQRVYTRTQFRTNGQWTDLESFGFPLTQLPTPDETDLAIERGDGTTDVQLPDEREFFDAAIRISSIMRLAKIEEAKRPLVIGSIILALWQGEFPTSRSTVLDYINANVKAAIDSFSDVPQKQRQQLYETLSLGGDALGIRNRMDLLIHQLERLNIRSIMRSGVDFLGQFYETFLRYGCNTKNMGIVFTPRHITRLCADLIRVGLGDRIYDPACGTGGFLVAAFDRMMKEAATETARQKARRSLYGRDTNATVWSLAMLNMLFRGDGKSRIEFKNAFDGPKRRHNFDRVLMNPPFSQQGEPEIDFIDHALDVLKPGGIAAIVVKMNVMIDPDLSYWRKALVRRHQILGVISLPSDLFYPTAASTVVLVVRAHSRGPQQTTFLAVVQNDGFTISKKRRIGREGSQLSELTYLFHRFLDDDPIEHISGFVGTVKREKFVDGGEICAERWLPAVDFSINSYESHRILAFQQIALAVANYPGAVDVAMEHYESLLADLPRGRRTLSNLGDWFKITNGRSTAIKNYPGGDIPYVSSGDTSNSVVGMVEPPESEIYITPHVTITAFGQAALQPWKFCARGNGGSAVRVLRPVFRMTVADLVWFIGQVNEQRWRFHYGRMATRERLNMLEVIHPPKVLGQIGDVAARVKRFRRDLARLASDDLDADSFRDLAKQWKRERETVSSSIRTMISHPAHLRIVGLGERAIPFLLEELRNNADHWFVALHAITGENPIPDESRGRLDEMSMAWVEWGEENGYL